MIAGNKENKGIRKIISMLWFSRFFLCFFYTLGWGYGKCWLGYVDWLDWLDWLGVDWVELIRLIGSWLEVDWELIGSWLEVDWELIGSCWDQIDLIRLIGLGCFDWELLGLIGLFWLGVVGIDRVDLTRLIGIDWVDWEVNWEVD